VGEPQPRDWRGCCFDISPEKQNCIGRLGFDSFEQCGSGRPSQCGWSQERSPDWNWKVFEPLFGKWNDKEAVCLVRALSRITVDPCVHHRWSIFRAYINGIAVKTWRGHAPR
jgi:hypothetical protein